MNEFQNPEAQRLAEISTLVQEVEVLDIQLLEILSTPESEERNFQRDTIQEEIDQRKAKLYELRNFQENIVAIEAYVSENLEMYQEFLEMGIPIEESSVAVDVFCRNDYSMEYLEETRKILELLGE